MKRNELHQAIDACRPGRGDERLPEFAELAAELEADETLRRVFDEIQRLDSAISAAMMAAPEPPEELVARLTAAVRAESEPAAAPMVELPKVVERHARRRWVLKVSVGLAALVVVGVIGSWMLPRPTLTADALLESSDRWWQEAEPRFARGEGHEFGGKAAPSTPLPVSGHVTRLPNKWLPLSGDGRFAREAVAFDLTPTGEAGILLFAFRPSGRVDLSRLPSAPTEPISASRWQVGVWQTSGIVYVLMVQGDASRYWQSVHRGSDLVGLTRLGRHPNRV